LIVLEHFAVNTFWIVGCLDQIGSERTDEHRFAHALAAIFSEISGDLAGPHRESHERDLLQVELF